MDKIKNKAGQLRGDGIDSGLLSMGRAETPSYLGGENVNRRPKTTHSIGFRGITH